MTIFQIFSRWLLACRWRIQRRKKNLNSWPWPTGRYSLPLAATAAGSAPFLSPKSYKTRQMVDTYLERNRHVIMPFKHQPKSNKIISYSWAVEEHVTCSLTVYSWFACLKAIPVPLVRYFIRRCRRHCTGFLTLSKGFLFYRIFMPVFVFSLFEEVC